MSEMINLILCKLRIHKWESSFKKYESVIRLGRLIKVDVHHRLCKRCNKKQIRTMLPLCNGVDLSNKWINK